MKKTVIMMGMLLWSISMMAQTFKPDSVISGRIDVSKDPRLDILGRKLAEFNEAAANTIKAGKGYRLLVLSSSDRSYAMKVRAQLLQKFPEQKIYMSYQVPYIRLKFGNFVEKADAEKYRKMLNDEKIVTTNIYLVPETVEIRPDKNKEKEEERKK